MQESQVKNLSEEQRHCGIIFDEMKIKENLVYDKFTGFVVGFIILEGSIMTYHSWKGE